MSLINKLLHDLEKREVYFEHEPDRVLDGLYSAYDIEQKQTPHRRPYLMAAVLFLSALLVLAVYYLQPVLPDNVQVSENTTSTLAETTTPAGVPEHAAAETTANASGESGPVVADSGSGDTISGVSLRFDGELNAREAGNNPADPQTSPDDDQQSATTIGDSDAAFDPAIQLAQNNNSLSLQFRLPHKVGYQVFTLQSPYRTVFELDDVTHDFEIPDFSGNDNVIAVRQHRDKSGKFRFVIESRQPYSIEHSDLVAVGDHFEMRVDLSRTGSDTDTSDLVAIKESKTDKDTLPATVDSQLVPETVVKGDVVKTARKPASVSMTEKLIYKGERYFREGRTEHALKELKAAVEHEPLHTLARTTLAMRLKELGQASGAVSLLEEGLSLDPQKHEWTLLLAQIHMQAGRLDAAEKTLVTAIPPIQENPEYHALYAAVLQQQDDHRHAAEIYRNLLQVRPEKGIWWMGLAISLEAISMRDDAHFAYRNALAMKSLTPETQQYIIKRLRVLEQQLGNEPT